MPCFSSIVSRKITVLTVLDTALMLTYAVETDCSLWTLNCQPTVEEEAATQEKLQVIRDALQFVVKAE